MCAGADIITRGSGLIRGWVAEKAQDGGGFAVGAMR